MPRQNKSARNEEIIALWNNGLGPSQREIARRYGIHRTRVNYIVAPERRISLRMRTTIYIRPEHFPIIEAEAARRGISRCRLLSALLDTIVKDNLFNAVLGDLDE